MTEMHRPYGRPAGPGDPVRRPPLPQAGQPQTVRRVTEYDDDEAIGLPQITAWVQRHLVILIGLVLILIELIWKYQFLQSFYFRQDDFHFTEMALQYGLNWKYLGYVGSGHLHPGVLLLVWILAKAAPYHWGAASWMTIVLIAIASFACLRMLRTLLGDRLAVLIPLALFLVTPLTLPDDSWWTSAIESLPLQITIFLAVTSQVHYVRSGRFRHALAAAGWLIVGLLFFEKAIAIPVVLLAVTAGFLIDGHILTSVRRSLTRFWRAWVLYAVIVGGYLVILLGALQHSTVKPKPTAVSTMVTFSWSLIRQTLLPGLLGGPWGWGQWPDAAVGYTQATSSLVWLSVFVTCTIIVVSITVRRRAWRAWAILALWVLIADVVPLLLGRLATAGFAQILGLDTRYVADAAPVAALAVALAFWPVVRDGAEAPAEAGQRQDFFAAPTWRVVGLGLTAVVIVGSFYSAGRYEKTTALYNYVGNVYLARVKSALADQPPGTVIMDGTMPNIVEDSIFYGNYARQSVALAPMESTMTASNVRWATHFDGPIGRLMMFDSRGILSRALVSGPSWNAPKGKGCAPMPGGVATLRFPRAPAQTTGIIRIGYFISAGADGEVVTVHYGSAALPLTLQQPKRLLQAYFSVSGSAPEVTITAPRSAGLCIGDVEAGNLVPGS